MLQYIAKENDRYSIAELVQMAIEGGCKWVVFQPGEMADGQVRETVREIEPLCKESGTILTIENHMVDAKELGIHGVLLSHTNVTPAEAREFCGPEAIIGVEVSGAMGIVPLKSIDVDYAALSADMGISDVAKNIEAVRSAGIELPIVAMGDYPASDIPALMDAGCSGLALGAAISQAADPVEAVKGIIETMTARKG